jgi:cytochrome c oxidase assembly factor CtaG
LSWNILVNDWTFEPLVVGALAFAAVLYWLGEWTSNKVKPRPLWKSVCFYSGLLFIFIALESPIDYLDGQLFWLHMLQHLLLIMVAAPLIILGVPAIPILRSSPLGFRRHFLRMVTTQSWSHRVATVVSWIASPVPAAITFLAAFYLWHWSYLFNLTLQNQSVHDLEHLGFLATALLFWSQVIEQRPVRMKMSYVQRAGYVVLVGAAGNFLAMYFVFATKPLYQQYARLSPRPFGMGALTDQQLAGALMWVPVLFVFLTAFCVLAYKWLREDEELANEPGEVIVPAYRLLDGSLSSDKPR